MIKSFIIYMFTILLSTWFGYLYQRKLKKNDYKIKHNGIYIFLIILPFLVTSGLRYAVGTDYFTYVEIYNYISSNINISNILSYYIEPLYVILNLLAKLIFNNYQGIFILSSFVFLFFSIKGIDNFKNKLSIPLAVFIFGTVFYHLSFNNVRQMIAVSIIFYALKYVFDRKFLKYLLFVLIAMGFHKTSIVCILLYFLIPNKEKDKKNDLLFYIMILAGTLLTPLLIELIKKILTIVGKYNIYLDMAGDRSFQFLLYILPLLFIIFIFRKKIKEIDYKNEFLVRLMVLQLPIQFLGFFMKYLDRFSLYVSIAQMLLVPMIISNIENKKQKRIWLFIIICWYLLYYLVMFVYLNGNETYPYFTIFSKPWL